MEIKVDGVRLEITWIICIFTMKTIQDSPARNCVFLVSCVMTHSLENILKSKNWYYMTICITYSARIQAGIHFYHWKTCRESSKYHFCIKKPCIDQTSLLYYTYMYFPGLNSVIRCLLIYRKTASATSPEVCEPVIFASRYGRAEWPAPSWWFG